MKLRRLVTQNIRGTPDGAYSFAHPVTGEPIALTSDWPAVAAARVTVKLPADAKLWVDGKPTKQTGPVREFVTPPVLRAGLTYRYTFRAVWSQDGQNITRERPVLVQATGSANVDFTTP